MTEIYGVMFRCSERHNHVAAGEIQDGTDLCWGPLELFKNSNEAGMICIPCSGLPCYEAGFDYQRKIAAVHIVRLSDLRLITTRVADKVLPPSQTKE